MTDPIDGVTDGAAADPIAAAAVDVVTRADLGKLEVGTKEVLAATAVTSDTGPIRVALDLSQADLEDPAVTVEAGLEILDDETGEWRHLISTTYTGRPGATIQPACQLHDAPLPKEFGESSFMRQLEGRQLRTFVHVHRGKPVLSVTRTDLAKGRP